ncbi:Endoribonuclease L-PSP/chorismate mutase-like protein [Trichoderma velutinum]
MSTPAIKEIRAEGVPANPLYSQGVTVGNMVFLAGVTGVDPATGSIVTGTVGERTTQILNNISKILEAAGSHIYKTVRVNIFLTDMSDYNLMNEAYKQVFNQAVKPVRTCVAVKELPRATDVEIEVTATL